MNIGKNKTLYFAPILVLLCICYNSLLALINAHLFNISKPVVVMTEIILLGSLILIVVQTQFRVKDRWPILLLGFGFLTTLIVFVANNGLIYVDALRNLLIISVLTMTGSRIDEKELHKIFLLISILVFIFLSIEIISLDTYVDIFRPADYYLNTRGLSDREDNDSGIFFAALGFAERFSFGVFSGPRTSSLFLEQVSLGNFASILAIYTAVFWKKLSKHRLFFIALIVLIILSSNSRFAALSVIIYFIGYFIFNKLPKYTNVTIFPLLLILGFIIITWTVDPGGDNLVGRVHKGFRLLYSSEISDLFGFGVSNLIHFSDSGLGYLFVSNTIFTSILVILFIKFYLVQKTPEVIRYAIYMNLYIFLNLVVSGNSIFSIKTASLIWILTGFMYNQYEDTYDLRK